MRRQMRPVVLSPAALAQRDAVIAHFGQEAVDKALTAFLLVTHGADECGAPQTMREDREYGEAMTYTMLAAMMPEEGPKYCGYCDEQLPLGKKTYCSSECAWRDGADWEATERDKYDMRYE